MVAHALESHDNVMGLQELHRKLLLLPSLGTGCLVLLVHFMALKRRKVQGPTSNFKANAYVEDSEDRALKLIGCLPSPKIRSFPFGSPPEHVAYQRPS